MTIPDISYALDLEPELAVDYFRSLGVQISDATANRALISAKARAFTIANVANIDVLNAVYKEIDKALTEGTSADQFVKNLKPRLTELGWYGSNDEQDKLSPYRLKMIYRANLQQAYAVSRYMTQLDNADDRPFWMRVEVMDANTRPTHAAVNGVIYRYDDPWWDQNYPPFLAGKFEFGCRGRVRALSETRLQLLQDKNPELTISESKSELTAYNTNNSTQFNIDAQLARRLIEMPDRQLRVNIMKTLNQSKIRSRGHEQWLDDVLNKRHRVMRSASTLGLLSDEVIAKTQLPAVIGIKAKDIQQLQKAHKLTKSDFDFVKYQQYVDSSGQLFCAKTLSDHVLLIECTQVNNVLMGMPRMITNREFSEMGLKPL